MKKYLIWRAGYFFVRWADKYFWKYVENHRFNTIEDLELMFYCYRQHLNMRDYEKMTLKKFRRKLELWCRLRGYTINPYSIMENRTELERKLDVIFIPSRNGKERIGIYIENIEAPQRYDHFE